MNLISQKTSLLILGLTSIVSSRLFFSLLNDPEGPNLLIVTVLAAVIFALSFSVYLFFPSIKNLKKLFLVIAVQIIVVAVLYFFLK